VLHDFRFWPCKPPRRTWALDAARIAHFTWLRAARAASHVLFSRLKCSEKYSCNQPRVFPVDARTCCLYSIAWSPRLHCSSLLKQRRFSNDRDVACCWYGSAAVDLQAAPATSTAVLPPLPRSSPGSKDNTAAISSTSRWVPEPSRASCFPTRRRSRRAAARPVPSGGCRRPRPRRRRCRRRRQQRRRCTRRRPRGRRGRALESPASHDSIAAREVRQYCKYFVFLIVRLSNTYYVAFGYTAAFSIPRQLSPKQNDCTQRLPKRVLRRRAREHVGDSHTVPCIVRHFTAPTSQHNLLASTSQHLLHGHTALSFVNRFAALAIRKNGTVTDLCEVLRRRYRWRLVELAPTRSRQAGSPSR
jgi:hypothetical protein